MRLVSVKTVSFATALFVGVLVSPVVAQQSTTRDLRGNAGARVEAQSQRPPLGPGEEELDGTLEVFIEDHPRGSVTHHFLDTGRGKVRLVQAMGETDLDGTVTGQRVRARGRRSQDGGSFELRASGSGDSSVTTLALASSNTFGQQRVLVIMVNFQDNLEYSTDYNNAFHTTFNEVNSFYQENSYGQTYLTGDVVGTYTLPMSSGVCDSNQIASLAEQAASNAGVNVNNYSRRVFAFPRNACSWWGLGSVGGNPSRAWVKGTYSLKVVAHELGHNFGDYHSNSEPCENGACSVVSYGDDRDIMGLSGTGHFNAFQKERLGWLNYAGSPSIQTVTGPGTYFISALQTPGASPKALKVLQSSGTYYYVEARAQIGFDAGYAPGVLIHTGNESNGNTVLQTDMDPITGAFDAILDPGQSYTERFRNITFRTVSADATGAWVAIDMPAAPCTMRAPNVTLSPSGTVSATAGVAKSFSLTVKNTDDNSCSTGVFEPRMAVPGDWSWTGSAASITLAPGASTSVSLSVTPSATAAGSYVVSADAVRTNASGPSNSVPVTMSVTGPTATPTPTPTPTPPPASVPADLAVSLAASTNSPQFTLTATVKNNGSSISCLTVIFSLQYPRGSVQKYTATTNSMGVATVKGRLKPKDPRGAYVASATASFSGSTSTGSAGFLY